jgi:hypothetical protein
MLFFLVKLNLYRDSTRQEHTFQGYKLLIWHLSGIEDKLLNLDVSQLNVYLRDVSLVIDAYPSLLFHLHFIS